MFFVVFLLVQLLVNVASSSVVLWWSAHNRVERLTLET